MKIQHIKTNNYVLLGILAAITVNHIDKVYIPLKESIALGNTAAACIYSSELLTFSIFILAFVVIIHRIDKGHFFTSFNVRCFTIMAVSMMLPPLTKTFGQLFVDTPEWEAFPMSIEIWLAAALFLSLIANIFQYGVKLQEEQDLTV